jgi:hypothetical protein
MTNGTFTSKAFEAFGAIKDGRDHAAWLKTYLTPELLESFVTKMEIIAKELGLDAPEGNLRVTPQSGVGDFTYGNDKVKVENAVFVEFGFSPRDDPEAEVVHAIIFLFNDEGEIYQLLRQGPDSVHQPSAGPN